MEFGKLVSDLDIDNDTVLLSSDVEALTSKIASDSNIVSAILSSDGFKDATTNIAQNIMNEIGDNITSYIDMKMLSGNVYDAMKTILDDYVLKKMLSNLMFDIISTYNDTVIDCLDGSPDGSADIDAGGAY